MSLSSRLVGRLMFFFPQAGKVSPFLLILEHILHQDPHNTATFDALAVNVHRKLLCH